VENIIVAGNLVVKMDSLKDLDIDYTLMRETLHNTLKSSFFFDVANYPTADFTLDYVEPLGKNRYAVSGDLSIKDIVNCIHFKSKIRFDKKIFSAISDTFDVDRTQYGITLYSPGEAADDNSVVVSNEIHFVVHITGKRIP
jgi:polyisoprenoid-binding protein YceI